MDAKKKFVDDYRVSDAAVHDSVAGVDLLSKKDKGQPLYADGAFVGEAFEKAVEQAGMINKIHEKGYRNHPLIKKQKRRIVPKVEYG